jgi:dTDP-4-dehydrorhamnose reductase
VRLHVTGETGYLGSALVRLRPDASAERVEIRDAGAVSALFERVRPDVVVHTAYRQDGADAWAINVEGSRNVARAAAAVGARLVHMSTDVVFDGRKGSPYVEGDAPSPVTDYGAAKAAAERLVAEAHPEALLVRTSLLYGGPEPSKHEVAALRAAHAFYTNEIRCPVQVGELAAALLELAESDASGPLHVAGPDAVSRAEFAELVAGHEVETTEAPGDRPLDCSLDSARARSLIRIRLRGVREILG